MGYLVGLGQDDVGSETVGERRLRVEEYRDKMAGGWVGQMIGVGELKRIGEGLADLIDLCKQANYKMILTAPAGGLRQLAPIFEEVRLHSGGSYTEK